MNKENIEKYLALDFGIENYIFDFVEKCEATLSDTFENYKRIGEYNSYKVIKAFKDAGISARHFYGSTGYGYSDEGREKLCELFALIFGTEDAIVSPLLSSGTMAISTALFGLLRPLDTMFCISGKPYDTLSTVIGLEKFGDENDTGTLKDYAIKYRQADLIDGEFDVERILDTLYVDKTIKMVYIQRSRGYDLRPAITISQMEEVIKAVKDKYPKVIVVVDNCYGEFVETKEPTEVGADIAIGSLIKNPGAGIAPTGGYIVGRKDLIELIANHMTCPGIGAEIGSYTPGYLPFFQGIYFAPGVVTNALCGATLTSDVFHKLGYEVFPTADAFRSDITQAILLKNEDELTELVRAVQASSPVDANVVPFAWDMPGYKEKVIMASGSFIQGSSIELSADAPMREPYAAYFQGGLTLQNIKLALMNIIQRLNNLNIHNLD